jgi:predicted phosphoribosyltransferase
MPRVMKLAAVELWYPALSPTTDEEVRALLAALTGSHPAA